MTVIYGAKNKKKDHQHKKNESYYIRQHDITKINKIITLATHVGKLLSEGSSSGSIKGQVCADQKAFQQLHNLPKIDLKNAQNKATKRNNLKALEALKYAM